VILTRNIIPHRPPQTSLLLVTPCPPSIRDLIYFWSGWMYEEWFLFTNVSPIKCCFTSAKTSCLQIVFWHFLSLEIGWFGWKTGLPDGTLSNQKSHFGEILEGLAKEDVCIFYCHSVYCRVIWYILWPFLYIFCIFFPIWYVVRIKIWQPYWKIDLIGDVRHCESCGIIRSDLPAKKTLTRISKY
jgi:hypothetical protein